MVRRMIYAVGEPFPLYGWGSQSQLVYPVVDAATGYQVCDKPIFDDYKRAQIAVNHYNDVEEATIFYTTPQLRAHQRNGATLHYRDNTLQGPVSYRPRDEDDIEPWLWINRYGFEFRYKARDLVPKEK